MAGDGDYYDLGSHSWQQEGLNAEAQRWFDRGVNWTYGYNHLEAVRCFERCLAAAPRCALAMWGCAYALGTNYNAPWETITDERLVDVRRRALSAVELAQSPLDRALTSALLLRFPQESKSGASTQEWDIAYASAMMKIAQDFSDHADVQSLTAEALMSITPWRLWNVDTGKPAPPPARTLDALEILERACKKLENQGDPPHPGLCHFMAHLMEMSPSPERALPQCDALVARACDTGHLTHMSTHVYILLGDYHSAMFWNDKAATADRRFLTREGNHTFYTLYSAHNLHFKMYAAMFMGHYGHALTAANEIDELLPERLLRSPTPAGFPFTNVGDSLIATRYHVWVRFGRWKEILAHPLPADQELYCVTTCTAHYAKSLAHALGYERDMLKAEEERQQFERCFELVPEDWCGIPGLGRRLHNNICRDILCVSRKLLEGELAYQSGHHDVAFDLLREAGRLESSPPRGKMQYDEPWGFMQPTRHALGALLLEQGRLEEAEQAYREDLGLLADVPRPYQHPDNVWALHGLVEALSRQGRAEPELERRLKLAEARADIRIHCSCFCRKAQCCGGASSLKRARI